MLMLQSVRKHILRMFCAWLYGPAPVPACLFKTSNIVHSSCDIQDGHYAKAQILPVTISVAMKEKVKQEIIFLVLGIVRGKIAFK